MLSVGDKRTLEGDGDEIAHTCGSAVQVWRITNFYLPTRVSARDTRVPRPAAFSVAVRVATSVSGFTLLVPQIAEE